MLFGFNRRQDLINKLNLINQDNLEETVEVKMEKWTWLGRGRYKLLEEEEGALPCEVWLQIFRYLSTEDLIRARRVCWTWNEVIMSDPSSQLQIRTVLEKAKKKNRKRKEKRIEILLAVPLACCAGPVACSVSLCAKKPKDSLTDCLGGLAYCVLCPIACPFVAVYLCVDAIVDGKEEETV